MKNYKYIKLKNNSNKYLLFILFIYLFVFNDFLYRFIPSMKYLDEIFACLSIPILISNLFKNKSKIKISYRYISIIVFISIFILSGLYGNLKYRYQPWDSVVLPQTFLLIKFWLSIYVGYKLFKKMDLDLYGKHIYRHVRFIVFLFVILYVINIALGGVFESGIRYGVQSTQLFYSHPTIFAANCTFLIAICTLIKNNGDKSKWCIIVMLLLQISTLRSKAIICSMCYILVYYLIILRKKKVGFSTIILILPIIITFGWSQFEYYYLTLANESARAKLMTTALKIAKSNFPFGTGIGTFGSYFSAVSYSPIYYEYGINTIWGLSKESYFFICDSFWPMIIGEIGILGMICYVLILLLLFKSIQRIKKVNKYYYLTAIYILIYLIISSTSEAAFVHPIAIPLAMCIGIILCKNKY